MNPFNINDRLSRREPRTRLNNSRYATATVVDQDTLGSMGLPTAQAVEVAPIVSMIPYSRSNFMNDMRGLAIQNGIDNPDLFSQRLWDQLYRHNQNIVFPENATSQQRQDSLINWLENNEDEVNRIREQG